MGCACLLGAIVGDFFPRLILALGTERGGYNVHEERGRAAEFRVQCPWRTLESHQAEEPQLDPRYANGIERGCLQSIEDRTDIRPEARTRAIVLAIRSQASLEHASAEFVRDGSGGRVQVHPHQVGSTERAVVSEQVSTALG